MPKKYFEYRGVSNAVYALITADTSDAFTTGEVKDFTGVSEIGRTTESSNEAHYYDNIPAIVIDSVGADEVTVSASGIPLDVLAELTGQYYDAQSGMLVEQEAAAPYVAFGYKTEKTDGTSVSRANSPSLTPPRRQRTKAPTPTARRSHLQASTPHTNSRRPARARRLSMSTQT